MNMLKIYFSLLMMCISVFSCLEDNSNENIEYLEDIVIEDGLQDEQISLFQHDTLRFTPTVYRRGNSDNNFTYRWYISNGMSERELGTNLTLNASIKEVPVSYPYKLVLEVTDTSTGIVKINQWSVQVASDFGEGLIVADTEDGVNYDLNLIMGMNFTSKFSENEKNDVIKYKLFSKCNNYSLSTKVKSIECSIYGDNRALFVLTDEDIHCLEPLSFELIASNNDKFYVAPDKIKPGLIKKRDGMFWIVNDGKMHFYSMQNNNKYFEFYYPFDEPTYLSEHFCLKQWESTALVFDELNHCFMFSPMWYWGGNLIPITDVKEGSFDPNNIDDDLTCIHMSPGTNNLMNAIMSNKNGKVELYSIKGGIGTSGDLASRRIDLSQCPEIDKALFFDTSNVENVIYYATENNIYAINLDIEDNIVTELRYTCESGEIITSMQIHRGSGSVKVPDISGENPYQIISSLNRMITIATYNGNNKEGKIITIPIEKLGIGLLNKRFIKEYGGFNKIVCIGLQDE